ncbi:MAG TPA: outer membrane beta-barrel protein [Fluviicola sp.]|nr:outer membrane beta-barrel protein [Fluviicola sp.]
MKHFLVCIILLFCSAPLFAQVTLSGSVTGKDNKPAFESLILLYSSDTVLIKTEVIDEAGLFRFEVTDGARYFLQVTTDEYQPYSSELITVNGSTTLPVISLQPKESNLGEVEVVAKKPYLERQPGKLILNVENSINSTGSSAFELLEKAPAVRINNNDVITLSGKSGIIVQIDGKSLPMSGTELGNYLRGIPSSSIEKIELISNPSSKYDAAGSAIINIKLKKDTRLGTNGTIAAGYGQGVYPKTNAGISLNHRSKRINVYGSYNYAYRKAFNHLVLERRFFQNDTFQGAYIQDNYLKFPFNNHIVRTGVDFNINNKNSISFVVNGITNQFKQQGFNSSDVQGPSGTNVSAFETTNDSKDIWYSGSANLNYKRVLDTLGSEWTVDLDYAAYGNNTQQLFTTRYYNLDHVEYQPAYLLAGDIIGNLSIYSAKTDFHKELGKDRSFDAGLKSSYVIADNNLKFFDRSSGTSIYDSTKSNHFIYKENINAGYVSYTQKIGKWMLQLGLRAEYTGVSGQQLVYNVTNDTSYLQLFPTAYLTYELNEKNSFEISYARRIDRPGYDQLNPFKFYLDPSTYKEGNPYLRPQTTHIIEIAHLWNNSVYTQLGIGRTLDNITEVIAPSLTQQNITVQTNTNLKSAEIIYFNMSVPLPVTKWWTTTNNLNSYVALYSGSVANTTINRQGSFAFNVQTSNSFTIGKTWTLEVNADYRSKELYAFDRIDDIWSFGIGAQKKILENRGTIRLNITDLFYTNFTTANVKFTDYTEYFDVKRETRVATLSMTYKFGKASVPASRRRAGGADDLKSRVNNSGVG